MIYNKHGKVDVIMLIQFTVDNFKSFKNTAVLSMEASADKELPDNITEIGKERYLNTAAIFGANASGKSNIFAALTSAIMLVRRSNARQVVEPLFEIVPYKFDPESIAKPTSFEFVFLAGGKKYVYGFSATQKAVHTEYLYVYNSAKASTVFERTDIRTYKFTSPALKRELLPLTERNTDNKLFLATATAWNCEATRIPYLWFESGINTYSTDFEQLFHQTAPMFEDDKDQSLKRFAKKILHEADINIDDYELEVKDIPQDQFLQSVPQELRGIISTIPAVINKSIKIETVHTITQGDTVTQYNLSLKEESQGTRGLFLFSPVLKRAFETGETLCIDEFDASLHPMLVRYLVSLFNNPEINKAKAQLIVSSHAMVLMSLKNLRRDQIYFVEKDRKTGVSELYSLDEFSPRKEEDIRKAYMLGRYGSVPDIAMEADLWQ